MVAREILIPCQGCGRDVPAPQIWCRSCDDAALSLRAATIDAQDAICEEEGAAGLCAHCGHPAAEAVEGRLGGDFLWYACEVCWEMDRADRQRYGNWTPPPSRQPRQFWDARDTQTWYRCRVCGAWPRHRGAHGLYCSACWARRAQQTRAWYRRRAAVALGAYGAAAAAAWWLLGLVLAAIPAAAAGMAVACYLVDPPEERVMRRHALEW